VHRDIKPENIMGDPINPFLPGTKLGFAQEHLIGFEQQLLHGFVLSLRYLQRG
jgi:serine/threonine protein kinase